MGRGNYTNLKKNRLNNQQSLYMRPQFSPRNKTSVCNRNDANSMVHKGLIFLFGGTIWELGIVIYSKSCYVSPHMSEMEIKEPKIPGSANQEIEYEYLVESLLFMYLYFES